MPNRPLPAPETLARLIDQPAGRYACYPGMGEFSTEFSDRDFLRAVQTSNGDPIPRRLSLHFTAPGIFQPCFCTECGPPASVDTSRSGAYLDRLVRELALVGDLFDRDRDVVQVSLDPGLTGVLHPEQVGELFDSASRHFHVLAAGRRDVAMTLDPAHSDRATLEAYAALGVNRASFALQAARDGSTAAPSPHAMVEACREAGLGVVRTDLVYGAPGQADADVARDLAAVIAARPDRIGLRDCAHLPESFRQPLVPSADRPDALARARLLVESDQRLRDAGYRHLGMDLYVLDADPLVAALAKGQLHRDALGYGSHGETDLVGFGVGAISQVGPAYTQAASHLRRWEAALDAGRRAHQRGLVLDEDDLARGELIQALLCEGQVHIRRFEERHLLDFPVYFARELERLAPLAEAGLVEASPDLLSLTSAGRLLSRIVAGCFDRYLHAATPLAARSLRLPA